MAVSYALFIKTARMSATRKQFAGGKLEILAANGTVLACFYIAPDGGRVDDDTWTMAFIPSEVPAEGAGVPTAARIRNALGEIGLTGLTVGTGKDIEMSYPPRSEERISLGQRVALKAATIVHI